MIGFRVDANEQIATGHLMRCMAIAAALQDRGEECLFLLAENKQTERLEKAGIPWVALNSRWDRLWEELPAMKNVIAQHPMKWLVVDSYQADQKYLAELNQLAPVLYVDDMGQQAWPVSAVLHYSDWMEGQEYLRQYRDTHTSVLAGMSYVPLRKEFHPPQESEGFPLSCKNTISVLVTTGGTDPFRIAWRLFQSWKQEYHTVHDMEQNGERERTGADFEFHMISGSMNQSGAALKELARQEPRLHVYENVTNMGDRMRSCDLAVSAGGTTLFELCACGIPTVCFSFADNQKEFVEEMDRHQIMLGAGDARTAEDIDRRILQRLLYYAANPHKAEEYRTRMQRLVDGKGADRIADFLLFHKN